MTGSRCKTCLKRIALVIVVLGAIGAWIGYDRGFREHPQPDWVTATPEMRFKYGSIGAEHDAGIPYWIFYVLPRVFPEKLTQDGKVDTWLQDRQTAKADNCVRELVWAEIERMMKSGDVPFYDGLTFEELEAAFYPEEDFYLDENGDPMFYLLENTVALPEAGILLVPISLETLLDEL